MTANASTADAFNPPPPLMIGEPNSFAFYTMTQRVPPHILQVLMDFQYPPSVVKSLEAFHREVTQNKPFGLPDLTAPDGDDWLKALTPYQGHPWTGLPWYVGESLFYRRLVEAAGYFTEPGRDPFLARKKAELAEDAPWHLLDLAMAHAAENTPRTLSLLLQLGVWGNRIDLSYTQVYEQSGRKVVIEQERKNLLVDDAEAVVAHLQARSPRLDFICDNTGAELLMDLALVDFLLRFNRTHQIVLHVKQHPTFVSDATPADIDLTLDTMQPRTANLANRLLAFIAAERLVVRPDWFWNGPLFFWDMPATLHAELQAASLVIIKGDANYRRLLGDSRWPTTTPIDQAAPYFPAPFVALRTLKSDPIVGLPPGLADQLTTEDSTWRVNGRRGLIQALL